MNPLSPSSRPSRQAGPAFAVAPSMVRNVVVVGHAGAGKTTLVEALLVAAGAVPRAGRVEDGTTVTDSDELEHRHVRSLALGVASLQHEGVKVTLIDTPGHADFVGELRAGLRAADAALFVVSAVDGLDPATQLLWDECASVGMPRAVVVSHLDSPRADFEAVVAICQRVFGQGVQPLYLPLLDDDEHPAGLLGLLSRNLHDSSSGERVTRRADPEHLEAVADQRAALIEGIIAESEDDTLLDRYLAGEDVEENALVADLETAVARGSFHPVLPVVATTGPGVPALGVPELLEVIVRGFPSPLEHPPPPVTAPDGTPREALSCDPDGPLVAEVVRTTTDPYVGRLSLVRVFSGTLLPDTVVHVCGHFGDRPGADHDVDERVGTVSAPFGAQQSLLPRGIAGDVVTVARLSRAETGDTLSDPRRPALMEPWHVPEPLLPVALTAESTTDEDKLAKGLARLTAEDATARVEIDPDTSQVVLWGMGETHLEVLLERLRSRTGVAVGTAPVQVALRETFTAACTGHGRNVKQSGGHGQYAVCDLEIEPLPEGSGLQFMDAVVGGAVPRQFVTSVHKGVVTQMERGVSAGVPVVDILVRLVGGRAHSVDSSDAAFQVAGAAALKDAATHGETTLLEPVDEVCAVVGDEYLGAALGDLAVRRARVTGTRSLGGGRSEITAEVPASELPRYAPDLRSLAHGTGSFTRHYLRHGPLPAHLVERMRPAPR